MRVTKWNRGLTVIEVVVLLSILVLLIAIVLPFLGTKRINTLQMQTNSNVRSQIQSMVTFANWNGERYPGVDARGRIVPGDASVRTVDGKAASGGHPGVRYLLMLEGGYFTGEIALSPSDGKSVWQPSPTGGSSDITTEQYSYAMLRLQRDDAVGVAGDEESLDGKGYGDLLGEWRDTLNSEAVVIADRNVGVDCGEGVRSVHTQEPGEWRGSVGYNDGHVEFEYTHLLRTKYANGLTMEDEKGTLLDNLFSDADTPERESGNNPGNSGVAAEGPTGAQAQAAMVYQDPWTYVNQK